MEPSTSAEIDQYGRRYVTTSTIFEMLYQNPNLDMSKLLVKDGDQYNKSINSLHADLTPLPIYEPLDIDIDHYDRLHRECWFMPDEYSKFDIAQWVLDQCKDQVELQRVAEELILFQERDLFSLLKYLKYFVDTMRKHNIVWGVGRGSSVSSFVLFLIGVHKINSIKFSLDIREFLK
jgi:DNA polymerase III alpha subunit